MKLSREEIAKALADWNQAWAAYDIEGVMSLFHDDVLFSNWTGGQARGKQALHEAWAPWFENHGGFRFTEKETFIDEESQKVLFRWILDWPSNEKGYEGKPEKREGVDIIHLKDGKIIQKLTYSKTTLEIEGNRVGLTPDGG
jgi:ketosteroid isomerase-like protein